MNSKFNFMKYRRPAYFISAILVFASIFSLSTKGLNYGIDFSGGISIDVKSLSADYGIADMRHDLAPLKPELQEDNNGNVLIRIGLEKSATDERQNQTVRRLKTILGDKVSYQHVQIVGPKIGGELIRGGILAIIFAFLMMSLYVWIRYRGGYAVGAMVSLTQDFVLMFGFYSLAGLEFSQSAIAVILTGVGYSINDKIVNYDRIMENSRKYHKIPTLELINISVNEMLIRTILTSVTTALGMIALLLLAGNVLGEFSIAMLFSIVSGTLSSIFISNSILVYFKIRDHE